jgi:hypothetical protein
MTPRVNLVRHWPDQQVHRVLWVEQGPAKEVDTIVTVTENLLNPYEETSSWLGPRSAFNQEFRPLK